MGSSSSKVSDAADTAATKSTADSQQQQQQQQPQQQYVLSPSQTWQNEQQPQVRSDGTSPAPNNNNRGADRNDKLRNGPCAETFGLLQKCQAENNLTNKSSKAAIAVCVSETDLLIRCVKKHPKHFKS